MAISMATGRGFASRVRLPNGELRTSAIPLLKELLMEDRVLQDGSECWYWHGSRRRVKKYPLTRLTGKSESVSRVAYQLWHGPIPPGQFVCHRCDDTACWNPDHLFLGTPRDNMRDMIEKGRGKGGEWAKAKTHCPRGHEYTEENTKMYRGRRYCRSCHTIHTRNYARRKFGVTNPRIPADD